MIVNKMSQSDSEHPEESPCDSPEPDKPDTAFYGFLNLPRNASGEEITAAYKKLARLYHPDKHQEPEKRAMAEMMFSKLNKAYGVLSDPHKRAIYDCLGEKGLEEPGWEMVARTKTPQEIREEYEELARAREERRLRQLTNPTSRIEATINATDLFDRYLYDEVYDEYIDGDLPSFEVSKISLSQSIEAPLSSKDTCTLRGNVNTSNGTGGGSVACSLKRVKSDSCWYEGEAEVGSGLNCCCRLYKKLTERNFVNMSGSLQFSRKGLKPGFEFTMGTYLDKQTVGYLRYSTSLGVFETEDSILLEEEGSSMSTILQRDTDTYRTVANIQFGIPYTYLILAHTWKLKEKNRKFRAALKLGTFGAILEYGCEERVSDNSVLGATMVVGTTGVTCRLKLSRASQTFLFPFHLSDEVMLQPIFYGTVVPLLGWLTVKKLLLEPLERRIVTEEEARGGLILDQCFYGLIVSEDGSLKPELELSDSIIDVTTALQCNVEAGRLVLWEGSKSSLPGVWDPVPGDSEKWLVVRYSYQGNRHQLLCHDLDAVKLPKTSHRVSDQS